MKRWIAALAALLLLVGGCGKLRDQVTDYDALVKETLAREYAFTGKMTYDGTQAEAKFTKTGAADITAEFSAPEALSGLVVKWGILAVCLCISLDNVIKFFFGMHRLRSGAWIRDVTV